MKLVLDRDDVKRLLGTALNRTIDDQDIDFKINLQENVFEVHINGVDLPVLAPTTDADALSPDGSVNDAGTLPVPSEEDDTVAFRELHQISEELVASVNHVSTGLSDRPLANNESYDFPGSGE